MQPEMPASSLGRVLVINDELDIREGLELLLTTEGYAADLAHRRQGKDHQRHDRGTRMNEAAAEKTRANARVFFDVAVDGSHPPSYIPSTQPTGS